MKSIAYQLTDVQDEFGNKIGHSLLGKPVNIKNAFINGNCVMVNRDNRTSYVNTGRVERIEVMNDEILITTTNFRYALKAVIYNG